MEVGGHTPAAILFSPLKRVHLYEYENQQSKMLILNGREQ